MRTCSLRQQKDLPRAFHNALLELSARTNSDERFRTLLRPTLNGVQGMVQNAIQREVETLLESYGTEYWDDRDVTYDNLIWGTSGIEIPIKRILVPGGTGDAGIGLQVYARSGRCHCRLNCSARWKRTRFSPACSAPATAGNIPIRCPAYAADEPLDLAAGL